MYAAVHRFTLQQSHMQMSCGLPESSSRIQGYLVSGCLHWGFPIAFNEQKEGCSIMHYRRR